MRSHRMRAKMKVLWIVVAMALLVLVPLQAMAQNTGDSAAEGASTDLIEDGQAGQQQGAVEETAQEEALPEVVDVKEEGVEETQPQEGSPQNDAAPAGVQAASEIIPMVDNSTTIPMSVFTDAGFRAAINKELKRLYNLNGNAAGLLVPDNANGVDYDTTRVGDLKKVVFISNEMEGANPIAINSLDSTATVYLENVNTITITAGTLNDLTPLLNMPLLYQAWIKNTSLNNVDLSVLDSASFANLRNLSLANTGITDEQVRAITANRVETLDLSDNKITDIAFLSAYTSLTSLDLSGNGISDLSPILSIVTANNTVVDATDQLVVVEAEARGAGQEFVFQNVIKNISGLYVTLSSPDATYDAIADPPVMTWAQLPPGSDSGTVTADFSDTGTAGVTFGGTLQIDYQKVVFRVYYEANGAVSGSAPVDEKEYLRNETATILGAGTMTWDKYTFLNWNTQEDGEGTAYGPDVQVAVARDITLYAQWQQNTYTISASAGDNGSITGSGEIKVVEGETYTFRFTPNAGYTVSSIVVDGNTVSNSGGRTEYPFTDVRADHEIHVFFGLGSDVSSTSPQTDDDSNIMQWLLIITISIGAILVALEYRRSVGGAKYAKAAQSSEMRKSETRMGRRRKK